MVQFLTGAVVLLTGISLVHLLLTVGLVRRIREHEVRLAALAADLPDAMTMRVGERVPDFETRATDGEPVRRAGLTEPALFGFFSPQCDACTERVPEFRRAAAAHGGPVVAVVVADGGDVETLATALAFTRVVVEEPGGPVTGAFGVRGFPAFAYVDADGVLRSRGFDLPQPAPA
jgi:peroxiredoxin